MIVADMVAAMEAAGCSPDQIVAAMKYLGDVAKQQRAERNRRYYQTHKTSEASETSEIKTHKTSEASETSEIKTHKTSEASETSETSEIKTPPASEPRARVDDSSKPLEVPGKINNPLPPSLRSGGDPPAEKNSSKELLDWFFAQWNGFASSVGLATTKARTDKRERLVRCRAEDLVHALGFPDPKAGFTTTFNKIRGSPHLLGQNGRGWRADLDWVLTESNFLKIHEGNYEKRTPVLQFRR